jgi:hypothetical protein
MILYGELEIKLPGETKRSTKLFYTAISCEVEPSTARACNLRCGPSGRTTLVFPS